MRTLLALLLGALLSSSAVAQQIPNPQPRDRVAHNTELTAAPLSAFPAGVYRDDYAAAFGAPPLFFRGANSACPIPGGDGGSQVPSADGKCWRAVFPSDGVDVRWFGADPTGAADARIAINKAFALGSNHTFIFPPGTYAIKSTGASPYPLVAGPTGLFLGGTSAAHLSNIRIRGHNAVITADNSNNNSNWMALDYIDHLEVDGLTFQANKTGYAAGYFPSAIIAWHLTDFTVRNIRLSGDWGGSTYNPAFFRGNWLVGGQFLNNEMGAIGQCFDLAYVQSIVIANNHGRGAGDAGSSAALPCVSIAYDAAMATNYPAPAPYNFLTARDVTIGPGNDISNFVYGIALRSGQRYQIVGNSLHDNPGIAGAVPGAGVMIAYETTACCPSATDPVRKVTITGNSITDNAAAQVGGGVMLDTTASTGIASGEVTITGNAFYNNNSAGVAALTTANLTNVYLGANSYLAGASQVTPIAAAALLAAPAPLTWTPTDASGAGLVLANAAARYDLSAALVHVYFSLDYPVTANGSAAVIQGLPITVANTNYGYSPTLCFATAGGLTAPLMARAMKGDSKIAFYNGSTSNNYTNANLSGLTVQCQLTYPAL